MKNNDEWLIRVNVVVDGRVSVAEWPQSSEEAAYVFASTLAVARAKTDLDTPRYLLVKELNDAGRYRDAVHKWNSIMEAEGRDRAIIVIDQQTHDTTDSNVGVDNFARTARRAG